MGFLLDTQATRSNLLSVDTTLAANIDATQDYIPVASTANFSTSVVAEIETTNEVVSFGSITTNRLNYSEQFDNGYWSKAALTVSANAGVAPNGTTTADKAIPNSSGGSAGNLGPFVSISSTSNTYSIFAKADGFNFISLIFQSGASNSQGGQFNLATGVVAVTQNATATITDAGNGWYRCSIFSNTAVSSGTLVTQPNDGSTPDTSNNFRCTISGDGTKGVLIWGAQLEAVAAVTGYLPVTSASLSGLTTVTRGVNGTTAASATSGDSIQQLPYALLNVDMPVRLQGLSVSSDGTGAGRLTLCDNNGDTLCDVDIPDNRLFDLDFGGGILFPNGIFISNSDNITAYTLFTDEYSGAQ
jgi:hypothetical protein